MIERASGQCPGVPLEELDRVAQVLRIMAHPHRLKALEVLRVRNGAPVHEVAALLELSPAATSQLLNQMRRVGLVGAKRRGREVWYEIADPRSVKVLDCICTGGGPA
jgi:DNA-binding transcriptional ArsR family regulator